MLTLTQLNNRLAEVPEGDGLISKQSVIYYWISELYGILLNIDATSLNENDKITRLKELSNNILNTTQ